MWVMGQHPDVEGYDHPAQVIGEWDPDAVESVEGLKKLRKKIRKVAKKALPIAAMVGATVFSGGALAPGVLAVGAKKLSKKRRSRMAAAAPQVGPEDVVVPFDHLQPVAATAMREGELPPAESATGGVPPWLLLAGGGLLVLLLTRR